MWVSPKEQVPRCKTPVAHMSGSWLWLLPCGRPESHLEHSPCSPASPRHVRSLSPLLPGSLPSRPPSPPTLASQSTSEGSLRPHTPPVTALLPPHPPPRHPLSSALFPLGPTPLLTLPQLSWPILSLNIIPISGPFASCPITLALFCCPQRVASALVPMITGTYHI